MKRSKLYGLVGKNIDYSFSPKYFKEKFKKAQIKNHEYTIFDLKEIDALSGVVENPNLKGFNVTIPYKETIMPLLDKISKNAKKIGAVNTVKISKKGKTKGYNTDYYGFQKSLAPLLKEHHKKALILGTGGSSKAVAYGLKKLDIQCAFVSRDPQKTKYSYEDLTADVFNEYHIVINTTPVGTAPNIEEAPNLNYELFTAQHIAYDLTYNPSETKFLKLAKARGAQIKNGYEMLVLQAEKSWKIWNETQK
ncbi:MAG: shikimate dehydrogenase [Flavobacterium sp.]|nr:shikimate dehydrogenase [Candidatus Neoflavobacterium equi]